MGSRLHSNRHRSRLRGGVWLLVLAMLWGMMAPRSGLAVAPSGSHWMEICTGHGIQSVLVDDEAGIGQSGSDGPASSDAECFRCLLHASPAPPAANNDNMVPLVDGGRAMPAAQASAIPPGPTWRKALPRAPPRAISL